MSVKAINNFIFNNSESVIKIASLAAWAITKIAIDRLKSLNFSQNKSSLSKQMFFLSEIVLFVAASAYVSLPIFCVALAVETIFFSIFKARSEIKKLKSLIALKSTKISERVSCIVREKELLKNEMDLQKSQLEDRLADLQKKLDCKEDLCSDDLAKNIIGFLKMLNPNLWSGVILDFYEKSVDSCSGRKILLELSKNLSSERSFDLFLKKCVENKDFEMIKSIMSGYVGNVSKDNFESIVLLASENKEMELLQLAYNRFRGLLNVSIIKKSLRNLRNDIGLQTYLFDSVLKVKDPLYYDFIFDLALNDFSGESYEELFRRKSEDLDVKNQARKLIIAENFEELLISALARPGIRSLEDLDKLLLLSYANRNSCVIRMKKEFGDNAFRMGEGRRIMGINNDNYDFYSEVGRFLNFFNI